MRSDVVHIKKDGTGLQEALAQTEAVAAYKKLPRKEALHLRLLTEEMAGMLRAMTGEKEGDFWIEDEEGKFKLHLLTNTFVNAEMREKLMGVSTSGKNISARGFIGKMVELFETSFEPMDGSGAVYSSEPLFHDYTGAGYTLAWSLNSYRNAAASGEIAKDDWDELEKSVVVSLADEIEVGVRGNVVELVITKKL